MRTNWIKKLIPLLAVFALLAAACGGGDDEAATTTAGDGGSTATTADDGGATETTAVDDSGATETTAASEPVTLRALLRPDEGANIEKFAAEFEAETGITVEVDFVGWAEIHDKTVTTLATGGGGYDIIFIPSANVVEFTSGGWFEPIDEIIPESSRGDWLQAVLDLYTVDGSLIAMPWYSGGAHWTYNASVLDAAGVDPASLLTMDDVMAACETIAAAGAADYCFSPSAKYPGNFYYNWGTLARSSGQPLFGDNGESLFATNGSGLAAMEFIAEGADAGYFDPAGIALDDFETLIEFGAGTTAFLLDSTWAVTQANRNEELSGVTGNAGYILIPGLADARSGGFLYAGGMGLLASSEHKAEAMQLMQYLTSEAAQKHHATEGANLPTRTALFSDAEIAAAWPGFDMLADQLNYGDFPPQFAWFEEWRQAAAAAVQDVMRGAKTPADAIADLEAEANRLNG